MFRILGLMFHFLDLCFIGFGFMFRGFILQYVIAWYVVL